MGGFFMDIFDLLKIICKCLRYSRESANKYPKNKK